MKEDLKKLNDVNGVIGSMVMDRKGDLLVFDMPAAYSAEMLQKAASVSFMSFNGIEAAGEKSNLLIFEYLEYRYMIKDFGEGLIGILATHELSMPVLNISLNIILKSIKSKITEGNMSTLTLGPSSQVMTDEFFSLLRLNLAKCIGPLASVIIDEKITEMGVGRNSFTQSLAIKLVNLLCDEIDNTAHSAQFSDTMFHYIEKK